MDNKPPQWKQITSDQPAEGVSVLTRIDDGHGPRNERRLKRRGRLWFFPDESMYVYYVPTHYAEPPEERQ